jgi:hypothetical protein
MEAPLHQLLCIIGCPASLASRYVACLWLSALQLPLLVLLCAVCPRYESSRGGQPQATPRGASTNGTPLDRPSPRNDDTSSTAHYEQPESGWLASVQGSSSTPRFGRRGLAGTPKAAPASAPQPPPPARLARAVPKSRPPSWHTTFGPAPLFLTDTERVLLLSCSDVDEGTVGAVVSPWALALTLPSSPTGDRGAGRPEARPVFAAGRIAWSKGAVAVSLLGMHVLVGAVRVWREWEGGQGLLGGWCETMQLLVWLRLCCGGRGSCNKLQCPVSAG